MYYIPFHFSWKHRTTSYLCWLIDESLQPKAGVIVDLINTMGFTDSALYDKCG